MSIKDKSDILQKAILEMANELINIKEVHIKKDYEILSLIVVNELLINSLHKELIRVANLFKDEVMDENN